MNSLPYATSSTLSWGIYTRLGPLPTGWAWIQHDRDWLLARDEFGRFFYVEMLATGAMLMIYRNRATVWDWIVTAGAVKPGTYFADRNFTIYLPRSKE